MRSCSFLESVERYNSPFKSTIDIAYCVEYIKCTKWISTLIFYLPASK